MSIIILFHEASSIDDVYGVNKFEPLVISLPDTVSFEDLKDAVYKEMSIIENNIENGYSEMEALGKEIDEKEEKVIFISPITGKPLVGYNGENIFEHTEETYLKYKDRKDAIMEIIDHTVTFRSIVENVISTIDGAKIEDVSSITLDYMEYDSKID